jgi:hypothetical protein
MQISGFWEMVDVCGLHDLGYEGCSWTFEKKVVGGSYCRVRLNTSLGGSVRSYTDTAAMEPKESSATA